MKIVDRLKEKIFKLSERIEYLENVNEHQMKALDKALEKDKILREFLEFPKEVSEKISNSKLFTHEENRFMYYQGIYDTLTLIKSRLKVEYMSKKETEEFIKEIEDLIKNGNS